MFERVPNLPWPANLFWQPHLLVANETTAPLRRGRAGIERAKRCYCGCGQNHNMAVSGLEKEGHLNIVRWFATSQCKSKYFGYDRQNRVSGAAR